MPAEQKMETRMEHLRGSIQDQGAYLHVVREQDPACAEFVATVEHIGRTHPGRRPLLYEYRSEGCELTAREIPGLWGHGGALLSFLPPRVAVLTRTREQFGVIRLLGAHAHRYGLALRPFLEHPAAVAWLHECPSAR